MVCRALLIDQRDYPSWGPQARSRGPAPSSASCQPLRNRGSSGRSEGKSPPRLFQRLRRATEHLPGPANPKGAVHHHWFPALHALLEERQDHLRPLVVFAEGVLDDRRVTHIPLAERATIGFQQVGTEPLQLPVLEQAADPPNPVRLHRGDPLLDLLLGHGLRGAPGPGCTEDATQLWGCLAEVVWHVRFLRMH